MQNIDEICPAYLTCKFLKQPAFLCATLFLVVLRVYKRNLAKTSFFLEIIEGAYMWNKDLSEPAWNRVKSSSNIGVDINSNESWHTESQNDE